MSCAQNVRSNVCSLPTIFGVFIFFLFLSKLGCIDRFLTLNVQCEIDYKLLYLIRSPYRFYLLTVGVEVVYFHLITISYTHHSR
jgi:hypothetical protein